MYLLLNNVLNNFDLSKLFFFNNLENRSKKSLDKSFKLIFSLGGACNLSCSYCYEKNKEFRPITFDDFKRVLDSFNHSPYEEIYIEFRGGEPLLHFPFIKKCIDYSETLSFKNKCRYYFITNGTLLTKEVVSYINQFPYEKFEVGISLDAYKEIHDKYRCNSWDSINFNLINELKSKIRICWTATPESLINFDKSLESLLALNHRIRVNFDFYCSWDKETLHKVTDAFLRVLSNKELSNRLDKVLLFNKKQLLEYGSPASTLFDNLCGCGESRMFYLGKDIVTPCQLFIEKVDDEFIVKNDEKCLSCLMFRNCQKCYGNLYSQNKNFNVKDDFCNLMSWKMVMSALYWLRRSNDDPVTMNKVAQILINECELDLPVITLINDGEILREKKEFLIKELNASNRNFPDKDYHLLLIRKKYQEIGYLLFRDNHIDLLYVHKEYRHQGYGTMLLKSAITYLKEKYKSITVVSEEVAYQFYLRNNFKVIKSKEGISLLKYDLSTK